MNKEQVIEIAKNESISRGWPFLEPIKVSVSKRYIFFGVKRWHVMTQSDRKGGNANLWVDDETKRIIRANFTQY